MWADLDSPAGAVTILRGGRLQWNEAVQRALEYPKRVRVIYDTEARLLGITPGAAYPVLQTDEGLYRVELGQDALASMGIEVEQGGVAQAATVVQWQTGEPEPLDNLVTVPYPESEG